MPSPNEHKLPATVSMAASQNGMLASGVMPGKPPPRDRAVKNLLSPAVGSLVTELAAGLYPLATIMQRYGLSKSQMRGLLTNDVFRKALVEAKVAYASAANLPERIKLKAQMAVEELLESMFAIAIHPAYHPSARVAAFSAVKSLTGLEKPEPQQARQKFSLTINLPKSSAGQGLDNAITIEAERDAEPDPDPEQSDADPVTYQPLTHDTFKKRSQGYVPRHDPGQPVTIVSA